MTVLRMDDFAPLPEDRLVEAWFQRVARAGLRRNHLSVLLAIGSLLDESGEGIITRQEIGDVVGVTVRTIDRIMNEVGDDWIVREYVGTRVRFSIPRETPWGFTSGRVLGRHLRGSLLGGSYGDTLGVHIPRARATMPLPFPYGKGVGEGAGAGSDDGGGSAERIDRDVRGREPGGGSRSSSPTTAAAAAASPTTTTNDQRPRRPRPMDEPKSIEEHILDRAEQLSVKLSVSEAMVIAQALAREGVTGNDAFGYIDVKLLDFATREKKQSRVGLFIANPGDIRKFREGLRVDGPTHGDHVDDDARARIRRMSEGDDE